MGGLFGGGKGNSAPPPTVQPGPSYEEMQTMLLMQGAGGGGGGGGMPAMPAMPAIPEIESVEPVDWREKQLELREKMMQETGATNESRKGRADTILTKSNLEQSGPKTTKTKLTATQEDKTDKLGDKSSTKSKNLLGI